MTRYLDLLHEIEEKTRQYGTDKNDKKGLVGFVSTPKAHKNAIFPDASIERAGMTEPAPLAVDPRETATGAACEESPRMPAWEPLTPNEETLIRRTLDAIGETDPAEINAVVEQCGIDAEARSYWLRRAFSLSVRARLVMCGTCRHFTRNPEHPRLGRCQTGGRENPAGNWDTDRRLCGFHQGEN